MHTVFILGAIFSNLALTACKLRWNMNVIRANACTKSCIFIDTNYNVLYLTV